MKEPRDMTSPSYRPTVLLLALGLAAGAAYGQPLSTQNILTPEELVGTILVGQGVTVSNVMFNGAPANAVNDQVAYFNGGTSNLGLGNGLVIATGKAELVGGANNYQGLTVPPANPRNIADPDLAGVIGTSMQRCVAMLEFDFIPTGDSLRFRFVFGSEEYPEYVCSGFNDGFGFFLSGPGISGPFSNGAVNLALLPGTQTNVAINTVNPGVPGFFGNASNCVSQAGPNWPNNSIYYVDNTGGTTVELDGFTVPLTAKAPVQCGQTYHIKMAIAHAMDPNLDSAVLIEGGSFSSPSSLALNVNTPYDSGAITEGCMPALITVVRPDTTGDATIALSYTGTGITPGDLDNAPDQVVIQAGSTSASFHLGAVRDGLSEGPEQLTITATRVSACGVTVTTTAVVDIREYEPMVLATEDLYLQCNQDSVALTFDVSGGLGQITASWGDRGQGPSIYVTGYENGTYAVTTTDQCPESASALIHVISGCELYIPNVITPNDDGKNDAWRISNRSPSGIAVKVFNRWGQEVFSSANYANNWRAPDMPDGTYFYLVADGKTGKEYTGHVTVLRHGRGR